MVNGLSGIETPDEILKKADWFDLAPGVHNLNLTQQILGKLLHQKTPKPALPAQNPAAPEPPADTAGPSRRDVIQTTIEFYDRKNQVDRLMLVVDTTDDHEYVCFNIISAKAYKDNTKYPGNVYIPKTAENRLRFDRFVKAVNPGREKPPGFVMELTEKAAYWKIDTSDQNMLLLAPPGGGRIAATLFRLIAQPAGAWVWVEARLFELPLSPSELQVYLSVRCYANGHGLAWPSIQLLQNGQPGLIGTCTKPSVAPSMRA